MQKIFLIYILFVGSCHIVLTMHDNNNIENKITIDKSTNKKRTASQLTDSSNEDSNKTDSLLVAKKSTQYYNPQRIRNLYTNSSPQPYRLSRSQIENFINCARCFYMDRKCGVGRPSGYPFNLNIAVDNLLKKEFDFYRAKQEPHPYCIENNIDAIPFQHPQLETWRNSLHAGLEYQLPGTNILVTGGIDDVWKNPKTNELIVVDYKATSKKGDVNIDADWQDGYKRQMEIYQWLFRKNGFTVSDTAYFVYCNGKTDIENTNNSGKIFDNKLEFDTKLIPYQGNDSWVEQTVISAYHCLQSNNIPTELTTTCHYCQYVNSINKHITKAKPT